MSVEIKSSSLTLSCVIVACLQCLFSRLRKYLVFFSPSLYHRDFDRKIAPFVWYSIILSSSRFFPSISHHICFFYLSLTSEWVSCSSKVVIDISISTCSFLRFLFLVVPYLIDTSLTFILTISHKRPGSTVLS